MKYDVSVLKRLTFLVAILPFIFFNVYYFVLLSVVILMWIDFFIMKKQLEKMEADFEYEYENVFIDEVFYFYMKIKSNGKMKIPLEIFVNQTEGRFLPMSLRTSAEKDEDREIYFDVSYGKRGNKKINNIIVIYTSFLSTYRIWHTYEYNKEVNVLPEITASDFRKESLKKLLPQRKSKFRILEETSYIDNINEYSGEPLNRIHWKLSARFQKLLVKKFSYTSTGKIHFILDLNIYENSPVDYFVWRDYLFTYQEDAVKIAASMVKNIKENEEDVILHVIDKNPHKFVSKSWIDYFDDLSGDCGEYSSKFDFRGYLENLVRELTLEDTVIILSLYLNEEMLTTLLKLRTKCSRVIVLIMPNSFRDIYENKTPINHEIVRTEIIEFSEKAKVLEENHIIVRIVSMNDTLLEVFENVPD